LIIYSNQQNDFIFKLDAEIERLENIDDNELERIRNNRIEAMKNAQVQKVEWQKNGK